MLDNWNYGLTVYITVMLLMLAASADKVASASDSKETPISSENTPEADSNQHTIAKRAWNQLQSGWGKRSIDDDSLEDLQRKLMAIYSQQLMANKEGSNEYTAEDYDLPNDKRAWKQMSNAWGKRDWSQLRGNGWGKRDTGNWNNMRGLWGKRNPGWNKLSSAWGK